MAFSRDFTTYTEKETDILLAALINPISIVLTSEKQAMHVRHRLYALRKAVTYAWEQKATLERKKLSVVHLDKPIIIAAQEVMSLTILKEGTTLTVGRRLIAPAIDDALGAALANAGVRTTEDQRKAELAAMEERLRNYTPEKELETGDNVYKNFGKKKTSEEQQVSSIPEHPTPTPEECAAALVRYERGELLSPAENRALHYKQPHQPDDQQ